MCAGRDRKNGRREERLFETEEKVHGRRLESEGSVFGEERENVGRVTKERR